MYYKLLIMIFILITSLFSNANRGIIYSGVDTLQTAEYTEFFDFILQRRAESMADYDSDEFNAHIRFSNIGTRFFLDVEPGFGSVAVQKYQAYGKMNLDSIKIIDETEMISDTGLGTLAFNVEQDSLKSLIGNCYAIKTLKDPRFPQISYFVKIKILDFDILDSASHVVKMTMLWAFDLIGSTNLTTTGIDTFSLDNPVKVNKNLSNNNLLKTLSAGDLVKKVIGNSIVIPDELVGKVKTVEVYSLQGKLLESIFVNYNCKIRNVNILNSKNFRIVRFK